MFRGCNMLKSQPDVLGFLTDSILKQRYKPPPYVLPKNVQDFCMNSNNVNIYRTFLINQRYVINCIIVDTVVNSVDAKQAKFILYKYKHDQTTTWISAKLDIPVRALKTWNYHINKHIQNMIFYNLDTDELFNTMALMNMINILDLRIESILLGANLGIATNKKWVANLCHKRAFYRKVLLHLAECQTHPDENIYNWIMSCRCRYPSLPISDFAAKAAINKATIYRHLKKFSETTKIFYLETKFTA